MDNKQQLYINAIVKMEEVLNPAVHATILLGHIQVRQLFCINWL